MSHSMGKVRPRNSKEIAASPLSVGFETLDRRMFDPERVYPHLAQLGVKWARVQTGWGRCEPERGRYDFAWLDAIVDSLLEIGIQPWFNLGYGNRLYTPEAEDASAVGWAPVFSEEARAGWTRFVSAIAQHFAGRVRHWEIWNEPNTGLFWRPRKPEARDYVDLVTITAPLVRRSVPHAVIIGGALAGMPVHYLEACLAAGLAGCVDRISYHPYGPLPEKNYHAQIAGFRKRIAQWRPGIALWQGECGCPSRPSKTSGWALEKMDWNETRQAKWLLRRILSDLCEGVALTSYFHTVDLLRYNWGDGPTDFDQSMGLLRGADYSPKPSYYAYQCLCTLFDAETKWERGLDCRIEGAGAADVLASGFVRGNSAVCAYWQPADLFEPFEPHSVSLRLSLPAGCLLDEPVLVDPLSQEVFPLPAPKRDSAGGIAFASLPLRDYPLIVADRVGVPIS